MIARGFAIEGPNVRVGRLEIDLVATKGDLVIVVEVRVRGAGSFQSALASVDRKKQERLVRAARTLYRDRYDARGMRLRFDVVAIDEDADGAVVITHVEGAFTA